jgi:hypothetical protein
MRRRLHSPQQKMRRREICPPRTSALANQKSGGKFRRDVQFLNQSILELSPALTSRKHFSAFVDTPSYLSRRGCSSRVGAKKEVSEAENSARCLPSLRSMV